MITQSIWQAIAFRACFGKKTVGALAVEVCARSNVIDHQTAVRTVRWESPPGDLLAWFAWSIIRLAQNVPKTATETVQFSTHTDKWVDVMLGPMSNIVVRDGTNIRVPKNKYQAIVHGTRLWEILLLTYSLICAKRFSTAHIVGCLLQSSNTDICDPLVPVISGLTTVRTHVIPNEFVKLVLSTGTFDETNDTIYVDPRGPNAGTQLDVISNHVKIKLWV